MNIFKTTKIALSALGRNKMRSFLTALGIIIGVGAVIAMVSIGQGAKKEVEKTFDSMGTNLLFVRPGSMSFRGVSSGSGSSNTLTAADAYAIEEQCDAVQAVSPSVSTRAQTIYGNKNWNASIQGVGEDYPQIKNWEIADGAFFDEYMVKSGQKVCVLGNEVNENLFEGADPIGQIIRINKIPFKVTGFCHRAHQRDRNKDVSGSAGKGYPSPIPIRGHCFERTGRSSRNRGWLGQL